MGDDVTYLQRDEAGAVTTVRRDLERAEALYETGRYEEAKALLAEWLARDADDARAWTALARCHMKTGEPDSAVEATGEALRSDPQYVDAYLVRSRALRASSKGGGMGEQEALLREAIRIDPQFWGSYTMLADVVYKRGLYEFLRAQGNREVRTGEVPAAVAEEAAALAREAIRLGPEEIHAYETALLIADFSGADEDADQLERAILRLDPSHPDALARQTAKAAKAAETGATRATTLYADGLAVAPDNSALRRGLDKATFRLLRGTRWLALACLVAAGLMIDLFATAKDPALRQLPVPLGNRLWLLVVMGAIWGLGAWRRYRKLRSGVQLNMRRVIRQDLWARIVLGQATWTMLCALLISQVPWTERSVPQLVFWAGLLVPLSTMSYDHRKTQ